uniref:Uncharacterized protein n=1 Tax=Gossypium raimondii TaxID=29730 RepID=A0A0D2M2G0_GOSRA|nr:hypothetical protein B456_001G238900 [Gossypium raimondii]
MGTSQNHVSIPKTCLVHCNRYTITPRLRAYYITHLFRRLVRCFPIPRRIGITPPQRRLPIPRLSLFSLPFSALILNAPILPRFLAQGEVLRPLSEIVDLSSTFSKFNTTINGPRGSGIVGDRGSREDSSVAEWPHGEEVPYWLGQQALETESVPRDKH